MRRASQQRRGPILAIYVYTADAGLEPDYFRRPNRIIILPLAFLDEVSTAVIVHFYLLSALTWPNGGVKLVAVTSWRGKGLSGVVGERVAVST